MEVLMTTVRIRPRGLERRKKFCLWLPRTIFLIPVFFAWLFTSAKSSMGDASMYISDISVVEAEAEVTEPDVYTGQVLPEQQFAISPIFTKEVQYWEKNIAWWADKYDLDPDLIATVMQIESCGHPTIESSAGAKGLFQVMPIHFSESDNPDNPDTNAQRGLGYLGRALELSGGDLKYALAGYNGGHMVIIWGEDWWADETLRYVYWGAGIYQDAKNGLNESLRLQEWLDNGGSSLCQRASEELSLFD